MDFPRSVGWGVALLIVAAIWSLTDLTSGVAAASSHAVLAGAVVLATACSVPVNNYHSTYKHLSINMTELIFHIFTERSFTV